jgi:hypothetical protein
MLTCKELLSSARRSIAVAIIAASVLTTSESPLTAAPAAHDRQDISAATASNDNTDFSARRRHRHYRHRGNAAGLAFMGFAIGTIAGAVAAQRRRDDCYDYGYCGPRYYYGGGPYYGRRYYYPPY